MKSSDLLEKILNISKRAISSNIQKRWIMRNINKINFRSVFPTEINLINKRILILAPHADDEMLGCGGLIAKYAGNCCVAVTCGGEVTTEATIKRRLEFERTMSSMGVSKTFYNEQIKSDCLATSAGKLEELLQKLSMWEFDVVLIPSKFELHPDHRALSSMAQNFFKENKSGVTVIYYEVWGALPVIDYFSDTTALRTQDKMKFYSSQVETLPYVVAFDGLAAYRGLLCGVMSAECYAKADF